MDPESVISTVMVMGALAAIPTFYVLMRGLILARHKSKWHCLMCGNCCRLRTINLTGEDISRMERAGYRDCHVDGKIRRVRGRCVFLKEDRCTIFGDRARPKICADFPFFKLYGILPVMKILSFCPATDNFMQDLKNEKPGLAGKIRGLLRLD